MATLSERWSLMSADEKAEYAPATKAILPLADELLPEPGLEAWPYVGDDFYPLSEKTLLAADVPYHIKRTHQQWLRRVGNGCVPLQGKVPHASHTATCGELWGLGVCCALLSDEYKAELVDAKSRVKCWFSMASRSRASFDSIMMSFPLFFIGDGAAASGAGAVTRGHVALLLLDDGKRREHEVLIDLTSESPEVGSIIEFKNLNVHSLIDHHSMARMVVNATAPAYRLMYELVGLLRFKITKVVLAAEAEAEYLELKAAERARRALLNLGRDVSGRRAERKVSSKFDTVT